MLDSDNSSPDSTEPTRGEETEPSENTEPTNGNGVNPDDNVNTYPDGNGSGSGTETKPSPDNDNNQGNGGEDGLQDGLFIFSDHTNPRVRIGGTITLRAGIAVNGKVSEGSVNLVAQIEDPSVLELFYTNVYDNCGYVILRGLKEGQTTVSFSDPSTGKSVKVQVSVYEGRYCSYTLNSVPLQYIEKYPTNFYNVNGLYVDSYTYQTDENSHWYLCSCGEQVDVEAHIYTDDADVTCNVCEYKRSLVNDFSKEPTIGNDIPMQGDSTPKTPWLVIVICCTVVAVVGAAVGLKSSKKKRK